MWAKPNPFFVLGIYLDSIICLFLLSFYLLLHFISANQPTNQPTNQLIYIVILFHRFIHFSLSEWPTIPQLYVNGEFIGGCDIITQMHESGELADLLKTAKSE